jgi:hypothetical protein
MWKWTKKDDGHSLGATVDSPSPDGIRPDKSPAPPDRSAGKREWRSPIESSTGGFVAKSIQDWMHEGEELYNASFKEFQELEAQLADLEARLAAKQAEVNQIAGIIGKPPVEGNRRLAAQLIDERGPSSVPNSSATIARALAGRQLNR